jgi:hypothetical protein
MQSSLIDPEIDTCRNSTELIDDDLPTIKLKNGKKDEEKKKCTHMH